MHACMHAGWHRGTEGIHACMHAGLGHEYMQVPCLAPGPAILCTQSVAHDLIRKGSIACIWLGFRVIPKFSGVANPLQNCPIVAVEAQFHWHPKPKPLLRAIWEPNCMHICMPLCMQDLPACLSWGIVYARMHADIHVAIRAPQVAE